MEQTDSVRLRKINKMKTIRGSLAIEGNSLSESQVTALIEGKNVIAPLREVQEVKNAIKTYDEFKSFNPYKINDLLKAHGLMTFGLIESSGHYRKGGVCVAGKAGISHIAPPADRVPFLICDLFEWLENSDDHILIKSSVFHYEFEFIHPFEDGNGRMGRFWQSILLAKWNPIFQDLPIENMIWENQSDYYKAIEESTHKGDSGVFIEFILSIILKTLQSHKKYERSFEQSFERSFTKNLSSKEITSLKPIIEFVEEKLMITPQEAVKLTGKSPATVRRYLSKLVDLGFLTSEGKTNNIVYKLTPHEE